MQRRHFIQIVSVTAAVAGVGLPTAPTSETTGVVVEPITIFYTEREGGRWIEAQFEGSVEDLIKVLVDNWRPGPTAHWARIAMAPKHSGKPPHPFPCEVHSVALPNRLIYDATLRQLGESPLRPLWRDDLPFNR